MDVARIEWVMNQLQADADNSRLYGTRRMAVSTLLAYAHELRMALRTGKETEKCSD